MNNEAGLWNDLSRQLNEINWIRYKAVRTFSCTYIAVLHHTLYNSYPQYNIEFQGDIFTVTGVRRKTHFIVSLTTHRREKTTYECPFPQIITLTAKSRTTKLYLLEAKNMTLCYRSTSITLSDTAVSSFNIRPDKKGLSLSRF